MRRKAYDRINQVSDVVMCSLLVAFTLLGTDGAQAAQPEVLVLDAATVEAVPVGGDLAVIADGHLWYLQSSAGGLGVGFRRSSAEVVATKGSLAIRDEEGGETRFDMTGSIYGISHYDIEGWPLDQIDALLAGFTVAQTTCSGRDGDCAAGGWMSTACSYSGCGTGYGCSTQCGAGAYACCGCKKNETPLVTFILASCKCCPNRD